MRKKFFSALALSALLCSSVYAEDDVLAIVSKGEVTSNSKGVTKLSLQEKQQIKGGYVMDYGNNDNGIVFQNLRFGMTSLTQIGAVIRLSYKETTEGTFCSYGDIGCSKSKYSDYVLEANPERDEFIAITATKMTMPGFFGSSIKYSNGAMIVRQARDGSYYRARAFSGNTITSEVLSRERNRLAFILYTRY